MGNSVEKLSSRSSLVLRNYPDDDALEHPEKYSKALSFSSDIIPLYGMKVDQSTLVSDASWRGFSGMPIVGGEVNNVYVRGHGSGGPHVAYLRAVPSELILWPQVWKDVKPVSSGPVVIPAGDTDGRYASDGPLQFRPAHTTGHTQSLVAHVFKHDPNDSVEPVLAFNSQNFGVDDFLKFLGEDSAITFYNVVTVDPTLQHASINTRLRMFYQGQPKQTDVFFRINSHEGAQLPDDLQVSLVDDRGDISIHRTPLSSFREQKVTLRAPYDGNLTLHIFSPTAGAPFQPYSGLSLQVSKNGGDRAQVLGALNVLFEHHSTRNIRFASPSATKLREYEVHGSEMSARGGSYLAPPPLSPLPGCGPLPVTKPAATGWWFRATTNDTNNFPHPKPGGISPDIQPVGTSLPNTNVWDDLRTPSVDYSSANAVDVVGNGENNYVFVRGHSTMTGIDVQYRLFALTASALLHPTQYQTEGIIGKVLGGSGTIAEQSIPISDDNKFYLLNLPFTIEAEGDVTDVHHCFIAEARQKHTCGLVYPGWPSEHEEDFATLTDFANWIFSSPLVCWRNFSWTPGQPGGECWTWCCKTKLSIPKSASYSTFWTIIIECDSPIIPAGSSWNLTCDNKDIFPDNMCFESRLVDTKSPAFAGCHFAGAPPDSSSNLTLCVIWCDGGKKTPPPSVKCRLAMTEPVTNLSPIKHTTTPPPPGSASWPFIVTPNYPYIGNKPHPSPLPTFPGAGRGNAWPYANVPNSVFGQVSLIAQTTTK